MPLYQLKTGSVSSRIEKFDTHLKAWNTLRTEMPEDKYVTLFMQVEMKVPLVQPSKFKKSFFKKYGTRTGSDFVPTKEDPHKTTYWMPVAKGITNHSYKL